MSIVKNENNITKVFYGHTPIYTFGNINSIQPKIDIAEAGLNFNLSTFSSVPEWADFSNVSDMRYMFAYCFNLQTIPLIDTSKVTSMSDMFYFCVNLTTIPLIDTSNVENMGFMFRGCENLTTIPELDTSKVNDMQYMFYNCSKLTSIPQLDVSNVTNKARMYDMFYNCINLTDIGGFVNLKVSIDISDTEKLTRESVLNIFNNMAVVDNETIYFHKNVISKLTDEDIAIATQKGWLVVSD